MLSLTRKPGEAIQIGDSIRIVFGPVRGNKIKVAIEAPNDIRIVREELLTNEPVSMKELIANDPAFDAILSADGYTLASL